MTLQIYRKNIKVFPNKQIWNVFYQGCLNSYYWIVKWVTEKIHIEYFTTIQKQTNFAIICTIISKHLRSLFYWFTFSSPQLLPCSAADPFPAHLPQLKLGIFMYLSVMRYLLNSKIKLISVSFCFTVDKNQHIVFCNSIYCYTKVKKTYTNSA